MGFLCAIVTALVIFIYKLGVELVEVNFLVDVAVVSPVAWRHESEAGHVKLDRLSGTVVLPELQAAGDVLVCLGPLASDV